MLRTKHRKKFLAVNHKYKQDNVTGRFIKEPVEDRLMSNILKDATTGCWVWQGGKNSLGYGTIYFRGSYWRVHRVSWELYKGKIPPGMQVCHTCDNRPCINPSHLFLGTIHDNMLDKVRKNRHIKGEAVNTNKLSRENVLYIREAVKRGERVSALARKFGVDITTIHAIKKGQSWAWLENDTQVA